MAAELPVHPSAYSRRFVHVRALQHERGLAEPIPAAMNFGCEREGHSTNLDDHHALLECRKHYELAASAPNQDLAGDRRRSRDARRSTRTDELVRATMKA